MKKIPAERLLTVGIDLLCAAGARRADAELVARNLVDGSLRGLDSHGIMRLAQYAADIDSGLVIPRNVPRVEMETATVAVVDCAHGLGISSAYYLVKVGAEKARSAGISCVVSKHCNHVGRLGAYVQELAEMGLVAIATANSSRHGHWVAPWGGIEGRLATNPLAFGCPRSGRPLVLDMSTAMISEGKIRAILHEKGRVPPGRVQDASGRPVSDPAHFYGPPHGTILPFGSDMGYKGFGLGLMVEVLSSTLAGVALTPRGLPDEYVNGLCLVTLDPSAFGDSGRFVANVNELCAYVKSSPRAPGFSEVLLPGEYEAQISASRAREGIPVARQTWDLIAQQAARHALTLESFDEL